MRILALFLGCAICCSLGGCAIVATTVDSMKRAGLTESDRQTLFAKQSKTFHDMIARGRREEAVGFVADEAAPEVAHSIRNNLKNVKHVDASYDEITFDGSAKKATARVTLRYFVPQRSVVEEAKLSEEWVFEIGGYWRLLSSVEES